MRALNKWRQMRIKTLTDLLAHARSDAASGCMIWTRSVDGRGYGCARFDGVQWKASRLAFYLATGTHPGKLCVCHRCDTPRCVNPDHLFLGTHLDNMRDMAKKGRAGIAPNPGAYLRARATCNHGHPWTEENTRWITCKGARVRRCKECERKRNKTDRRVGVRKLSLRKAS